MYEYYIFLLQEREKQIALKQLKHSQEKLREKYFERKLLENVARMKAREDHEAEEREKAVQQTQKDQLEQLRLHRLAEYHQRLADEEGTFMFCAYFRF